MKKLLTISIAAYNVEKYLEECLESFIDSYLIEKCEVLIIDDGSSDNTSTIAGKYETQYPQCFKHIKKENGGWGSTVNVAIQYATGKYFKLLDGDDYFETKALKRLVMFLHEADSDLVVTPICTLDDSTKKIQKNQLKFIQYNRKRQYPIQKIKAEYIGMHSCTVMTKLLKEHKVRLLEKCFYTDAEFMVKILNICDTVAFLDEYVYFYRISRVGQSVSIEGFVKHKEEHKKVLHELISYQKNIVEPYKKKFTDYMLKNVVNDHYYILIWSKQRQELIKYDEFIKKQGDEIYHSVGGVVKLLRLVKFHLFNIVATYSLKKKK